MEVDLASVGCGEEAVALVAEDAGDAAVGRGLVHLDVPAGALEVRLDLVGPGSATVVVRTAEDGEVARAEVGSGAAVRLPLLLTGKPCSTPAERLATPSARNGIITKSEMGAVTRLATRP